MRDPTRGGVAATLNEVASSSGLNIELIENALPIDPTVRAAADMLGFDLLDIANEGKVIMVVASDAAEDILQVCKGHPLGAASAVIGTVLEADESAAAVEIVTVIGGRRVVQMPYGRELPRIC
jgi:hydrogenase expression/formation protein HypE